MGVENMDKHVEQALEFAEALITYGDKKKGRWAQRARYLGFELATQLKEYDGKTNSDSLNMGRIARNLVDCKNELCLPPRLRLKLSDIDRRVFVEERTQKY